MLIEIRNATSNPIFIASAELFFKLGNEDTMSERKDDYVYTGWTPTVEAVKPATKEQMIAARDLLLEMGMKESAAALDNAIDVIQREADEMRTKDAIREQEEISKNWEQPCDSYKHFSSVVANSVVNTIP